MKNRRSYPVRGTSSTQGSGEASAAAADGNEDSTRAADGMGRQNEKSRSSSPVSGSNGRDVAVGESESTWTGEKKIKIRSTPTPGELDKIARDDSEQYDTIAHVINHEQVQGAEQIEGFDWDDAKLSKEIDKYYPNRYHGLPDNDDEEFWILNNEQQLTEVKKRLALYRIRAHEMLKQGGLKGATDSELIERYPLCTFEEKGYYHWFERDFEWYFDPDYCEYARLQDYQRLMLYNNGEYENWEYYRKTCSTLESDQEFVQFWEKLSCQIKRQRIERLAYYHAEKTAAEFPNIFSTLLHSAFTEYMWSIWFDNTWYKDFACLYFEIWKLIAKEKMNFKAALDQVKDKGMQSLCRFEMRAEIESDQLRPGPITRHYETYLAGIDVNVEEGYAYQLIMDAVKKFVPKRKMYYDYAKKKLDIAYEIGVIPPNPHKSST